MLESIIKENLAPLTEEELRRCNESAAEYYKEEIRKRKRKAVQEKPKRSFYYDVNQTMSRQRLFNYVVGARGCGKTYGAKDYVINRYLRYGEQFVYIRRYETELPQAEMRNFFDDIAGKYHDTDFSSGRGLFRINKAVAGWYIPLSKAAMLKSIPFPNVGLIIFDEFIIETGMHHYLPNEVRSFLECYSTISRDRDVPVLFLSNAMTMSNPYFLYFDVHFQPGQKVFLTEDISVEILKNPAFEQHMNETRFGRMIKGTEYGNYAVKNQFLLDTENFIEKLPAGCSYIATIIIQGKELGFYLSPECCRWYMSEKVDKTCPGRYTLDIKQHTEETVLSARNNVIVQRMLTAFCTGRMRFSSMHVKNICWATFKKLI